MTGVPSYRDLEVKIKQLEHTASKHKHDELETRVDNRTKALAKANKELLNEIKMRREIESRLREREEYFRAVFQTANDAIITIDHLGTIIFWNNGAETIFGYKPRDIVGWSCSKLMPKRFRHLHEAGVARFDPKNSSKLSCGTLELVGLHKKGHEFIIELSLASWNVGEEYFFTGIIRDISDRKELEKNLKLVHDNLEDLVEQRTSELALKHEELIKETTDRLQVDKEKEELEDLLRQSQKMEAIGTLAGGIAHDFNNILAAVMGYTELVISDLPEKSSYLHDLNQVLNAGHRAKELVQQILTFGRKSNQELRPLRIQLIAKEVIKLIRSSIPTTIEIKHNIDESCQNVLADPTQIHQVIMNLCTNAYYAMKNSGGLLDISLQPIELNQESLNNKTKLKPGSYLKLEISDTGIGISKDVQDKIFEPYYTTKAQGEGTGLGLAVVHGIINSLKGDITLNSNPGIGTAFQVYLPVAKETTQPVQKIVSSPPVNGIERIIVVDDDDNIVKMHTAMLTKLGYDVTGFVKSIDALDTFKKAQNDFDMIITDMTMPKMTGAELARQIFAIRPNMPVILCTGFSELINEEKAKEMGICKYLLKPVGKLELSKAIRDVLDHKKEKQY